MAMMSGTSLLINRLELSSALTSSKREESSERQSWRVVRWCVVGVMASWKWKKQGYYPCFDALTVDQEGRQELTYREINHAPYEPLTHLSDALTLPSVRLYSVSSYQRGVSPDLVSHQSGPHELNSTTYDVWLPRVPAGLSTFAKTS
jgi:hypothetical protein